MDRCLPVAVDAGDGYTEADAVVMGALALAASGDPEEAERRAREGLARGRELGSVRIPAMARLALARAATRRGDRRAASAALRAARHAIRDRGLRVMHGDLAETEAMLALDRGAWDDAIVGAEELGRALDVVPMQLWSPLPSLIAGRALLGRGDVTEATPLLREAVTSARRVGAAGTLALATAVHDQSVLLSGRTPQRRDRRTRTPRPRPPRSARRTQGSRHGATATRSPPSPRSTWPWSGGRPPGRRCGSARAARTSHGAARDRGPCPRRRGRRPRRRGHCPDRHAPPGARDHPPSARLTVAPREATGRGQRVVVALPDGRGCRQRGNLRSAPFPSHGGRGTMSVESSP